MRLLFLNATILQTEFINRGRPYKGWAATATNALAVTSVHVLHSIEESMSSDLVFGDDMIMKEKAGPT